MMEKKQTNQHASQIKAFLDESTGACQRSQEPSLPDEHHPP